MPRCSTITTYLDPELQAGTITPERAFAVLTGDVVTSEAMARQEVDRYTFRAPGQATSYFHGYTKLVELRAEVEKALGPGFDQKASTTSSCRRACCRPR